jgi:hypothetical protein
MEDKSLPREQLDMNQQGKRDIGWIDSWTNKSRESTRDKPLNLADR